jgi:hypothetical protein
MDAVESMIEFYKNKERMCKAERNNDFCTRCEMPDCEVFTSKDIEKAVEIVEKWSKENPQETYATHFIKLHPKTLKASNRPGFCRGNIYGFKKGIVAEFCNASNCDACWNEPYTEDKP